MTNTKRPLHITLPTNTINYVEKLSKSTGMHKNDVIDHLINKARNQDKIIGERALTYILDVVLKQYHINSINNIKCSNCDTNNPIPNFCSECGKKLTIIEDKE